ncbi:MAG: carboxypeptidase-like regulatory domain-containing protein, partial [Sphingobacteriales bacterium]
MKLYLSLIAMLCCTTIAFGQNNYKAIIKDAKTKKAIPGASVKVLNTSIGASADSTGAVTLTNIPTGEQVIQVSYIAFESI